MPGTSFDSGSEFDPQDQAETFDESNLVGGERPGGMRTFGEADDMATFEELPDVLDITQAAGDRDEDEALSLDAAEFDEEAVGDTDFEEDDELHYAAATEEREDDLDGLGPEDAFDEDRLSAGEIEGMEEVRDAGEVEGGEDDFTDFQARKIDDEDLKILGYAEDREGETRAKPDR